MKILVALIASLSFSSLAYGSYLESCEFTGNLDVKDSFVLGESKGHDDLSGVALFTVKTATDKGSHSPEACQRHVGQTVFFTVEDRVKYHGMAEATVSYFYVNSLGPDGVMSSTRYDLIEASASSDALDVLNIQTAWINRMPGGFDLPRPTKTRLFFDAVVMSSGCTKPSDFEANVVNIGGEQVLSVKRIKPDYCRALSREITVSLQADGFDFSESTILYNDEVKEVDVRMAF